MKPNFPSAALCAAVAALAVAGCGSSNKSSSSSSGGGATSDTTAQQPTTPAPSASGGGASSNLKLAADESGQLKFDKTTLSAKAGNVTITMTNPAPVPHAIAIKGQGSPGKTVSTGGTSTVTASLKPGTYEFYCPVDGHEAAGMKGTLTVK